MSRILTGVLVASNIAMMGYIFKDHVPEFTFIGPTAEAPSKPSKPTPPAPPAAAPKPTAVKAIFSSFGYYTSQVDPDKVAASGHKMMIVNEADKNSQLFEADDVAKMKSGGKIVVAEVSLGHAESYRWYWKKEWNKNKPSFIGEEFSPNRFYIKGLDSPEWWNITTSIVDKMIEVGYDGIVLDGLDAWIDMGASKAMRDDVIDYVIKVSNYAKKKKPGFLIIPKNSEQLGTIASYAAAVDAVLKESLIYTNGSKNDNEQVVKAIRDLKEFSKPVYVIEYVTGSAWNDAKQRLRNNGFVGYSTSSKTPAIIRENVW